MFFVPKPYLSNKKSPKNRTYFFMVETEGFYTLCFLMFFNAFYYTQVPFMVFETSALC